MTPTTAPAEVPARQPEGAARKADNRLDPAGFPHPPRQGGSTIPTTIENVGHLLAETGHTANFNVITKQHDIRDRAGNAVDMNLLISLGVLNGMSTGLLPDFVNSIARSNPRNPVADWIRSKPWDREDRLAALYGTVKTPADYPADLKRTLLKRWLLSATAAALLDDRRFRARGVLTFQGPQGIGKTTWIANLMPAGELRNRSIKLDHHMDGANKDSILSAIAHWVTEIGELDGAFKRDVARLKGFLTNDCDKVRPPYARASVEYDRRTVFAATVNDDAFLVDPTGNSRWWTIAVDKLDYDHGIDMQQLFAQLAVNFEAGDQWWLTPEEEQQLAAYNVRHRAVSAIAERVRDLVGDVPMGTFTGNYQTAIEVLAGLGIKYPSNAQCKECGAVLRELLGEPKRVNGRSKWRIPLPTRVTIDGVPAVGADEEY